MVTLLIVLLAAGLLLSVLFAERRTTLQTEEHEEYAFETYLRMRFPNLYE